MEVPRREGTAWNREAGFRAGGEEQEGRKEVTEAVSPPPGYVEETWVCSSRTRQEEGTGQALEDLQVCVKGRDGDRIMSVTVVWVVW